MKAFETPEEKRARRLAKKEAKERKKREKMGWGEEYMGYTNTDNPFGDNNLLGTFIWNKVSPGPGTRPGWGAALRGVFRPHARSRAPASGAFASLAQGGIPVTDAPWSPSPTPRSRRKLHTVPYPPVPPRACD